MIVLEYTCARENFRVRRSGTADRIPDVSQPRFPRCSAIDPWTPRSGSLADFLSRSPRLYTPACLVTMYMEVCSLSPLHLFPSRCLPTRIGTFESTREKSTFHRQRGAVYDKVVSFAERFASSAGSSAGERPPNFSTVCIYVYFCSPYHFIFGAPEGKKSLRSRYTSEASNQSVEPANFYRKKKLIFRHSAYSSERVTNFRSFSILISIVPKLLALSKFFQKVMPFHWKCCV